MKNKCLLKVVAGVMLSVSLAAIPTVYFTESALAVARIRLGLKPFEGEEQQYFLSLM